MNIETGEVISGDHQDFEMLMERGALMSLDEAGETNCRALKRKLARTQVALEDRAPLSKNAAKKRRKLMRVK